ncbi:hypothetical protein FGO68_gene10165 [Halteria grandinella]|uniref:Uncharacterized protein n=1 Tax=Halteria grandinella TaxID=5974 RepID=A0A8J8NT84_HALGN|nr:hypothetical protein FGO68_gene10165 [Halteria grandinella]
MDQQIKTVASIIGKTALSQNRLEQSRNITESQSQSRYKRPQTALVVKFEGVKQGGSKLLKTSFSRNVAQLTTTAASSNMKGGGQVGLNSTFYQSTLHKEALSSFRKHTLALKLNEGERPRTGHSLMKGSSRTGLMFEARHHSALPTQQTKRPQTGIHVLLTDNHLTDESGITHKPLSNQRKSLKDVVLNLNKSPRAQKKPLREMNFKEVIDHMHERQCFKNIKKYKEELLDLRAQQGVGNRNISHGRLKQERQELIKNIKPLTSQLAYKHRLLNSYVQLYRERLSLANTKADFQSSLTSAQAPVTQCTITIDFDELHRLTHATEEAGFDPYSQYVKIMGQQRQQQKQAQGTVKKEVEDVSMDKMLQKILKKQKKKAPFRPQSTLNQTAIVTHERVQTPLFGQTQQELKSFYTGLNKYTKQSHSQSRKLSRTMRLNFGKYETECSNLGKMIVKTSKQIVEEQNELERQKNQDDAERRAAQQRAIEEQMLEMIRQRSKNVW